MKTFAIVLALIITSLAYSQKPIAERIESLNNNSERTVKLMYSWKIEKDGKRYLKVNFKNKTKVAIETYAEFGFFINGVQKEKGIITDCLKKYCINNWFRSYHLLETETLTQEDLKSNDLEIQLLEFKIEETDECRETDSE